MVTMLAAGGTSPDPALPSDGIDVMSQLTGAPPVPRELYWRVTQRVEQRALRSGDWKYLATADGAYLFDLASDPGERNDLRIAQPDVFARLEAMFAAWESEVLEPVPLEERYR
jgi:arylsulfatase A-like enzyme